MLQSIKENEHQANTKTHIFFAKENGETKLEKVNEKKSLIVSAKIKF